MKKIILFVLLVTVAMGTAFAQKKQKLGEAEAKKLLEKVSKNGNYTDVDSAIRIVNRFAKTAKDGTGLAFSWPQGMAKDVKSKKIKQIFELIDGGANILDKMGTVAEAWDLAWKYNNYANEKDKSFKKAANLQFDTLDFAAGMFVGGAYYKAGIKAGKALLSMYVGHLGDIRWTEIMAGGLRRGTGGLTGSNMLDDYPTQIYSHWQDPDYYDFAHAWFCAAYDPKNDDGDDKLILKNIGEYIWAIKTLQKAGLL
jgi:hypothetical protein